MKTLVLSLALSLLATGCSMTVPLRADEAFDGLPKAPTMAITWVAVDDPTTECKRLYPKQVGHHPVIAACAHWDFEAKTCKVVTGRLTSHAVLGHEIRHCFEGAFHD